MKNISKTDAFLFDEEPREVLRMEERLLKSDLQCVRDSAPSILVVAEPGSGLTSYAKAFSEIVADSIPVSKKGYDTFLELVFPKDNEKDLKLFFSSPKRVAVIRNKFYGTFLISFEEFSGMDLIRSSEFVELKKFIEANLENIHFIFCIRPDFNAKDKLFAELADLIRIKEVSLIKPDLEQCTDYMMSCLNQYGFTLDKSAKTCLSDDLLPDLIKRSTFMGYKSLNVLINAIISEFAINANNFEEVISYEIVSKIAGEYCNEVMRDTNGSHKMGFRV